MHRRTLALITAMSAAAVAQSVTCSSALAVTQWSFEDGTTQGWGPSFSTPSWSDIASGPIGATDGGSALNFNIPNTFTFGAESNTRPRLTADSDVPAAEGARWDAFVTSNLLLADVSATGTNAPEGTAGDTLRAQYVAMWPAFNGRGPANGQPSLDSGGNRTYTFIGSYDRPIDFSDGSTARYQIAFSPGYYAGVKTHTFAWDYVNAGYDFSKLTPSLEDMNYTLMHWTSNTDSANPYLGRMGIDNLRVYRARLTDPTYSGAASGGTFAAANFANNFVSGAGAISIFRKIADADTATVAVNSPVTVGTLMLNNAPRTSLEAIAPGNPTSYTFAGAATLTLDAGTSEASLVCVDGDNAITAPLSIQSNAVIDLAADPGQDGVPGAPATLAVNNVTLAAGKTLRTTSVGTLTINGNFAGGSGSGVAINGGKTVLAASGAHVLATGSLTVAGSAQLDLTNNAAVIDYTGTSPLGDLTAAVVRGFAGGAQTGTGIVSSSADANTALGIIESSTLLPSGGTFRNQAVDSSAVLIAYTYRGDSDLSGVVDFTDLLALARNYGGTAKAWSQGDSNYDGSVDFSDLLSLARNYSKSLSAFEADQLSGSFRADFALAQSLAPEPATLCAVAGLALFGVRRQRRAH